MIKKRNRQKREYYDRETNDAFLRFSYYKKILKYKDYFMEADIEKNIQ
ncbi:hypothetical protein [Garciella nitratireducens]|nr:hypothetical protein [Garciella nitratireducens]